MNPTDPDRRLRALVLDAHRIAAIFALSQSVEHLLRRGDILT